MQTHSATEPNFQQQQELSASASAAPTNSPTMLTDFDFMPCRYFKSSFARSLSLNNHGSNNNNNNTNSTLKRCEQPQSQAIGIGGKHLDANDNESSSPSTKTSLSSSPPPPALPARRQPPPPASSSNSNSSFANTNLTHFSGPSSVPSSPPSASVNQLPTQHQHQQLPLQQHRNLNFNSNSNHVVIGWPMQDASITNIISNHNHFDLPQQQPQQHQQQQSPEQTLNVEAVILQNQVDTLQWQLKQTETNCEMYRAVMEEVARFFERYQQQQQQQQQQLRQLQQQQQAAGNRLSLGYEQQQQQIARSKSLHHVHGVGGAATNEIGGDLELHAGGSTHQASYLRARSSTNLQMNKSAHEEHNYESIAPAGSYNAFKDFTWRRSPKKVAAGGCKTRLLDAEEKLNQEAFRLARTIRNLLHTSQQQPDLTQPRHSLSSLSSLALGGVGRLCKARTSSGSAMTLLAPPLHNSTIINSAAASEPALPLSLPPPPLPPSKASNASPEMLFLRANNMRDSRLSLRSSTDSSVHSTISSTASSSSKIETDEETTTSSSTLAKQMGGKPANGSSTEDESGFSSISSFHDVGLPFSSTLINGGNQRHSLSAESRNSTLKSSLAATHPNNVVGVPLQQQQQMQPQHSPTASTISSHSVAPSSQSSTPSKTFRNANRYQRFSTLSNEDAAAVLWV